MKIAITKTGNIEIDRQHAGLLLCLAEVRAFIGTRYAFAAGFTAIQTLREYIENHFSFEENLLRQRGYPDLDAHIEQHRSLVAEILRQWERVETEGANVAREVVETIERWVVDHINSEDFAGFVEGT